ncbi:MAG: hypothetical protein MJ116_06435 [Lachnospiraceae bacterium]|nr:hypothetical protein [Lachnospiraceae bacterium]
MKYESLYDEFIQCFPDDQFRLKELAEGAAAEPSDGMHIMFGMVVVPFLMELLNSCKETKLKAAFEYFEKMAEAGDPMVSEVLEFTVLEDIISRGKSTLDKCKSYMGQKTIESCVAVEKYMM